MRRFLEALVEAGLCEVREKPIDLADLAAEFESDNAIWFKSAGPEQAELVGNVVGSRARMALAFGVKPTELMAEVVKRLKNKPELVEIARADAPVQQVVLTGDQVDLTALPVHLAHGLDGAPYISASVDYVRDSKTGMTNVGIRRLMLRGKDETGVDLVCPSDLRAIYEAAMRARRDVCRSAFIVGSHPVDMVAATMRVPVDEIGLVAACAARRCRGEMRDQRHPACRPMPNMSSKAISMSGATRKPKGPYGEFLGYYGGVKPNPVFHLTAITHRERRGVPDRLDRRLSQ